MGKINQLLFAFNRGIISKLGLARVDIPKVGLSAEIQTNWFPRLLGSMMLRPGTEFIGNTYNNNKSINLPFIFSKSDTALIELSDSIMRVRVNEKLITRPSVSTTISNGDFINNLNGWTIADEAGATSSWAAGNFAQFIGTGLNNAKIYQLVNVSSGGGIEHALRVVIERGPIQLKIGSSFNGEEYLSEITLGTGYHSLSFVPNSNFYVTLSSSKNRIILVKSVNIEAVGIMTIPSPYTQNNLPFIRPDQSADVIYIACKGLKQRKIERRSTKSWSIVLYEPEDGPVKVENTTQITLTAGALNGNTTLAANKPLFKSTQVGSLYKLISVGQNVAANISSANTFSDYIIVRGVGITRYFTINISGTWVATVTLERSFDEGTSWENATTFSSNITTTFDDNLDNQVVRYRIGTKSGEYTSGTASVALSYSLGSITGYCRITSFVSSTLVNIEILKALGSTNPTSTWAEGEWSDYRGYPTALALVEGRLGHAGKSKIIISIADAYESFNDEIEGDSGLISRTIGSGPIDNVNWLISLYKLFIGTDSFEKVVKTSSFEEPMTPTNFRVVDPSSQGSAPVNAVKLDKKAIFVQASGTRIFELNYDQQSFDYGSNELTKACPEVGEPGIIKLGVQRQPDTMIHCVRSDGKVAILIHDQLENLKAWFLFETNGEVEDVVVLPGDLEDKVYYTIKRTVNGSTVRYLERFAMQNECQGGILNKQADSFIIYQNTPTNIITGLSHLEGEDVIVWADGIDLSPSSGAPDARIQKTYLVSGGQITLDSGVTVSNAIVGLPYKAQYKSSKLAYASSSPINQPKKVNSIGVVASNIHSQGLRFGRDFNNLDNLPKVFKGKIQPYNTVYTAFDEPMFSFNGNWDADSRLCLEAQAPRPCTLLSAEIAITTNDKQ